MIEMRFQQIQIEPKTKPEFGEVMNKLAQILDAQKFCGTINMKFEHGKLMYINMNQGFTVDELVNSINI